MREEYDFSKAVKNPYTTRQKKQVTINIDAEAVDYFKAQAERTGIPYQMLINYYLLDCMQQKRQLSWL